MTKNENQHRMFSIMIPKRHILFLAVFVLFGPSFLKAGGDETAIKVNGRKITVSEFISRLNSLPRSTKGSPEEIKENLISALIAESVLAYEASSTKLDTSEQYRLMTEEFKKEALYEKWMDEEIRNKVKYSEKELQDMYAKMREIRTVEYWTFKTENEASEFKRIAEKDTSILMPPQTKDLICGEALEDVENAVYKLKKGELTSPLFVENSYYVFRLKSVAPHPEYSKRNYVYWISEAETYVKNRKEKDLLNSALLVLMRGKEFTIDTKAYDYIHSKLYPIVYGSNNQLRFSSPEMIQLDLINEENNNDINIDNRTVVRFKNGEEWKVKDLWKKISVSPYPLNFKNPEDLKPGLLDVIRRIIIVESIAGNAEQLGLGNSPYVRSETEMWSKNLSASYFIKNYSSSLAITDEEIAALYDTVKYNFIKP
ncbi:MAG TPA: SurA N-terminal domain-containing protein, partial [Ignavibacteriales bacterium]|nr:SurA N-terminal domain-containing protein [Ignavibacteriales bacterium]